MREDGSLACWGWDGLGQASPPYGDSARQETAKQGPYSWTTDSVEFSADSIVVTIGDRVINDN